VKNRFQSLPFKRNVQRYTAVAMYDGVPFMTSAGPCKSTLVTSFIK
jgi:hypothetical protein